MVNLKSKTAKKSIENEISRKIIVNFLFFIILFLALFNISVILYNNYKNKEMTKQENILSVDNKIKYPDFLATDNITIVTMNVPAVDDKGNGLSTSLTVEAMPGTGRTLVDIDNLLFWADTQQSIRTARKVAANITGLDINEYDLIYRIYANATVIGGESAGAALTLATVATLEQKRLNNSVMITGTINHDGSIGPVSEIISKAKAAKKSGAILFLVPLLQSRDVIYETSQHCEKFGPTDVCTVEQVPKKIVVSSQTGINTLEVGSIKDAMNYFLI